MTTDFRAMCAELVDAIFTPITYNWEDSLYEAADRARALLAEPVAEAPTVMEIIELHTWLEDEWRANNDGEDLPTLDFARAVLAKWGHPTPQPVAVSERLPGPEDCLDEGWGWFFNEGIGWLPANALPIPEATNE